MHDDLMTIETILAHDIHFVNANGEHRLSASLIAKLCLLLSLPECVISNAPSEDQYDSTILRLGYAPHILQHRLLAIHGWCVRWHRLKTNTIMLFYSLDFWIGVVLLCVYSTTEKIYFILSIVTIIIFKMKLNFYWMLFFGGILYVVYIFKNAFDIVKILL